jgi:magnesium transporter
MDIPPSSHDEDEPVSGYLLDSKTSLKDDILLEKVEHAIHKQTALYQHSDLIKIAHEHDPIDLAKASTRLPIGARLFIFKSLPDVDAKASFLMHATSPTRVALFRSILDEELRHLIERMPPDEAVSVLEDLPYRRVRKVLEMLDEKKARKIAALQQHRRHTAGRLMTNEFFAFQSDTTVGRVAERIRDNPGIELTFCVFVLDDDLELLGFVPDRNIIVNKPDVPLKQLLRPIIHQVSPETPREEVVDLFERYRLVVLPVVNQEGKLIGVINQDDVVEVMEDIADETIANIGGTAESVGGDEPTWKRFVSRAPWLLVTLFAGLVTATGISYFHNQPWFLVVPFFVPLITGMSGNVGIQCSTVLIRSMAMGELSSSSVGTAVKRELRIGVLVGVSFGILCGLAAYILNVFGLQKMHVDPVFVGIVVSSGVCGACFSATILGTLSPLFFARFGIDPAIASGPIVTACNDVLATYMYFFVAWLVATVAASMCA